MKLIKCNKSCEHSSAIATVLAMSSLKKAASRSWKLFTQFCFSVVSLITHDGIRKCCLNVFILLLTCISVFGKIKNGYEKDISAMKESLVYLQNLLLENKELEASKRRKVEASIQTLLNHVSYYELTENLLTQFKIIAPGMFAEIDTITDRLGRSVDVYVKFVAQDATEVKAWGITYASQMENDKDAYLSEYGPFTVSVKVWVVGKALQVLSHEFGHVKYQVPNLSSYLEFHKAHYWNMKLSTYIGHNPGDPSGKSANQSAHNFGKAYVNFLRTRNEKIQNPAVLLTKIRKSLANKYYTFVKTSRPTLTM
jgi:hypothetical protein